VPESFIRKEGLLARRKYKLCAAVLALQDFILVLHLGCSEWPGSQAPWWPGKEEVVSSSPPATETCPLSLVLFPAHFLAHALPRKGGLRPALLAWLHVVTVLLDFLDDVGLLDPPLESPQRALQGLTFLYDDF